VKVVGGKYMGRTGRVVSVKTVDGSSVAIILTDGINTEIQSNVGNLQMSSEVRLLMPMCLYAYAPLLLHAAYASLLLYAAYLSLLLYVTVHFSSH
jgi:hypothetical protein